MKYVQVNNKDTRTTLMTPSSSVSIANFEQENIRWDISSLL